MYLTLTQWVELFGWPFAVMAGTALAMFCVIRYPRRAPFVMPTRARAPRRF